jgi:hypothetical protein
VGYGYVLHLDDQAARRILAGEASVDPAGRIVPSRDVPPASGQEILGRSLLDAVADGPYPTISHPRTVGPWRCAGAFHSTAQVLLRVSDRGIGPAGPDWESDDDPAGWSKQWTAGMVHQAVQQALRHPPQIPLTTVVPDAVHGSAASVWWLYASALPGPGNPAILGAGIQRLLDTRSGEPISWGSHANALQKAGTLHGVGPVHLVWSGNRVCLPEDLTPRETEAFTRRR